MLICDILYGESDMGSVIMEYDRELIAHKLQRWDKFITDYHLPDWDSIPDFGLLPWPETLFGDFAMRRSS